MAKSFGQEIIEGLRELDDAIKTGKPVRQDIMRRMIVKGKTVYVRESFMGPVQGMKRKRK